MEKKIKLTIDNRPVRVAPGTTILDAAESVGIAIPTLCHIDLKGTCVKNNPASCRIGNKRMLEILTRITEGKGEMADLDQLQNLATVIKDSALCGLGQTSPNPVLSTLANFRDEYVEHVRAHKCRAKKCKALLTYTIDPLRCKGCSACAKSCPAQAIMGETRKPHVINPYVCIRCGMCISRCHFGAISVI